MKPVGSWRRARELFEKALGLDPEQRADFLDRSCSEDDNLRRAVEELLAVQGQSSGFLEQPSVELVAKLLAEADGSSEARPDLAPYRIVRELGRGGMGVVYLAERDFEGAPKKVAVKILPFFLEEEFYKRFRTELRLLALLEHPGVARLVDFGRTPAGQPFLVLEYIEGLPITDYCRRRGLNLRERLELLAEVSDVVASVHQQLVVHCDLKPGNLLVDTSGKPRLLDFGIAKLLDPALAIDAPVTQTGRRPATPAYASPEQLEGGRITVGSDVYALGVLAYELTTGRRPYEPKGNSGIEEARLVRLNRPRKPSQALESARMGDTQTLHGSVQGRKLRGDIDNIILKALRAEPEERYSSAERLADDIRRYLAGHTVTASGASPAYRVRKFVRRSWKPLLVGGTFLVLLSSFAVVTRLQADHARREAAKAQAVSDFLVGLFDYSDPAVSRRGKITAREVLDLGVADLERSLENEPLIKAELLDTISNVYQELGLERQGEELAREALDLREGELPDTHADVAESLRTLGIALDRLGKYQEAEPLLMRAIVIQRRQSAQAELAETIEDLANLNRHWGRYDEARGFYEEALALKLAIHGAEHLSVARALNNFGRFHEEVGNYQTAEAHYRRCLAIEEAALGPEHLRLASVLNNLAGLLRSQGNYPAAIPLFERSLEIKEANVGPDHVTVAITLNNLALIYSDSSGEDRNRALPFFERSLAIKQQALGPEHSSVAHTLENLGLFLLDTPDIQRARSSLERALAIREKAFGPSHALVAQSLNNLAYLEYETGNYQAAEAPLRRALQIFEEVQAPIYFSAIVLEQLGKVHAQTGRSKTAEDYYRRALNKVEEHLTKDPETAFAHQTLASIKIRLGLLLDAEKRHEEAQKNWAEAAATLEDREGKEDDLALLSTYTIALLKLERPEAEPHVIRLLKAGWQDSLFDKTCVASPICRPHLPGTASTD